MTKEKIFWMILLGGVSISLYQQHPNVFTLMLMFGTTLPTMFFIVKDIIRDFSN